MDQFEVLLTSEDSGQLFNVNVWNVVNGQSIASFKGGTSAPGTLCVANGDYLLSAQPKKAVIQIYEINRKSQQARKIVVPGIVKCMTINNSGVLLAAGVAENILVWELNGGELLAVLQRHYQDVRSLCFSIDGRYLIAGGDDSIISVWNVASIWDRQMCNANGTIDPHHCFTSHVLSLTSIIAGLRNRVFSCSLDRTIKIHDIASKRTIVTITCDTGLTCMSLDPSERRIFCGGVNGSLFEINLRKCTDNVHSIKEMFQKRRIRGHDKAITCMSESCDASMIVTGSEDNYVKIWDTESLQCIRTISHKGCITNAQIVPFPTNLLTHSTKPKLPFPQLSRITASDPSEAPPKYFSFKLVVNVQHNRIPTRILRIDLNCESTEEYSDAKLRRLIDQCEAHKHTKDVTDIKKLSEENEELHKKIKKITELKIEKILSNDSAK